MMRRLATAILVFSILLAACLAGMAGEATITFYHTSDIHENSAQLARIARFVQDQRAAGKNVVFVDTGDWFNKGDLTALDLRGEAMAELMGAMGYDAIIPGNHDYSHGTKRLAELIDKFSLPVVAANCAWPKDATPKNARAYRIFKFDGLTVGVIGTATPNMGNAADRLLEIQPIQPAVANILAKSGGVADIFVLLTHIGPPGDRSLVEALPRLDVIFGGHHHKSFETLNFNGRTKTVLQHSGYSGRWIGEVVIDWDGEKIVRRSARLVNVTTDMPESAKVVNIRDRYLSKLAK